MSSGSSASDDQRSSSPGSSAGAMTLQRPARSAIRGAVARLREVRGAHVEPRGPRVHGEDLADLEHRSLVARDVRERRGRALLVEHLRLRPAYPERSLQSTPAAPRQPHPESPDDDDRRQESEPRQHLRAKRDARGVRSDLHARPLQLVEGCLARPGTDRRRAQASRHEGARRDATRTSATDVTVSARRTSPCARWGMPHCGRLRRARPRLRRAACSRPRMCWNLGR